MGKLRNRVKETPAAVQCLPPESTLLSPGDGGTGENQTLNLFSSRFIPSSYNALSPISGLSRKERSSEGWEKGSPGQHLSLAVDANSLGVFILFYFFASVPLSPLLATGLRTSCHFANFWLTAAPGQPTYHCQVSASEGQL